MKEFLEHFDKAFENKIRIGIMSALVVNDQLDFKSLKNLLGVTDGNLASHLKNLEQKKYIRYKKVFLERKPNTRYSATNKGKEAFVAHIKAIENLLHSK